MGLLDGILKGRFDENSNCGINSGCKNAKACISQVCAPARALYGESVYDPCVTACQKPPRPITLDDVLCDQPQNAWEIWGHQCPNFTPSKNETSGWLTWAIPAVIALILLILIFF